MAPKKTKAKGRSLSSEWVPGRIIREQFSISEEHLKRLRDEGTLKHKTHWIHVGRSNAARPTYRYNLKRCQSAIDTILNEVQPSFTREVEQRPILEAIALAEQGRLDPIKGIRG